RAVVHNTDPRYMALGEPLSNGIRHVVVAPAMPSGVNGALHCLGYGRGESSAHRGPSLRPVDTVRVDPESVLTGHQASRRVRPPDTVRTVRTNRVAKRDQCLLDLLRRCSRCALAEDTGGERVGVSAEMCHPHLDLTALGQR